MSDLLFTTLDGRPINFSMPICAEKAEASEAIQKRGGCLTSITGGNNTIRIIPESMVSSASVYIYDKFRLAYIYDCIKEDTLLDLSPYRIGKSKYTDKIEVNKIMYGQHSWQDCELRIDDEGESIVHDFPGDPAGPSVAPSKAKTKTGRRDYTHQERRAILNYIIDNRKYGEVKGRNLWIEMEQRKICPGRSWESMKEHFRKYIVHHLNIFKLDQKTCQRLMNPYCGGTAVSSSSDESDEEIPSRFKTQTSPRKMTNNKETRFLNAQDEQEGCKSHDDDDYDTDKPKKNRPLAAGGGDAARSSLSTYHAKNTREKNQASLEKCEERCQVNPSKAKERYQTGSEDSRVTHQPDSEESEKRHQANPEESKERHQAIPKESEEGHQAIPKESKGKHQAIPKESEEEHQAISKESEERHQTDPEEFEETDPEESLVITSSDKVMACAVNEYENDKVAGTKKYEDKLVSSSPPGTPGKESSKDSEHDTSHDRLDIRESPGYSVKGKRLSQMGKNRNDTDDETSDHEHHYSNTEPFDVLLPSWDDPLDEYQTKSPDKTRVRENVIIVNPENDDSKGRDKRISTEKYRNLQGKDVKHQEIRKSKSPSPTKRKSKGDSNFTLKRWEENSQSDFYDSSSVTSLGMEFETSQGRNLGGHWNGHPDGKVMSHENGQEDRDLSSKGCATPQSKKKTNHEIQGGQSPSQGKRINEDVSPTPSKKKRDNPRIPHKVKDPRIPDILETCSDFYSSLEPSVSDSDETMVYSQESNKLNDEPSSNEKGGGPKTKRGQKDTEYSTEESDKDYPVTCITGHSKKLTAKNQYNDSSQRLLRRSSGRLNSSSKSKKSVTKDKVHKKESITKIQVNTSGNHSKKSSTNDTGPSNARPLKDRVLSVNPKNSDLSKSQVYTSVSKREKSLKKDQVFDLEKSHEPVIKEKICHTDNNSEDSFTENDDQENRSDVLSDSDDHGAHQRLTIEERSLENQLYRRVNTRLQAPGASRNTKVIKGNMQRPSQKSGPLIALNSDSSSDESYTIAESSDSEDERAHHCHPKKQKISSKTHRDGGSQVASSSQRVRKSQTAKEKMKSQYTKQEDIKILEYIISNDAYNELGGCNMWKAMEKEALPHRTWQGLKERFRKRIASRLTLYASYLSPHKLKHLEKKIQPHSGPDKVQKPEGLRRPYNRKEDRLILDFIVRNKRHSQISGKLLWVLMSQSVEGLNGRSWLSLKERFRKTIMKNISSYDLSENDLRRFLSNRDRHLRTGMKEEHTSDDESDVEELTGTSEHIESSDSERGKVSGKTSTSNVNRKQRKSIKDVSKGKKVQVSNCSDVSEVGSSCGSVEKVDDATSKGVESSEYKVSNSRRGVLSRRLIEKHLDKGGSKIPSNCKNTTKPKKQFKLYTQLPISLFGEKLISPAASTVNPKVKAVGKKKNSEIENEEMDTSSTQSTENTQRLEESLIQGAENEDSSQSQGTVIPDSEESASPVLHGRTGVGEEDKFNSSQETVNYQDEVRDKLQSNVICSTGEEKKSDSTNILQNEGQENPSDTATPVLFDSQSSNVSESVPHCTKKPLSRKFSTSRNFNDRRLSLRRLSATTVTSKLRKRPIRHKR